MRLFGLSEANAHVPMLLETFTRVRELEDDEAVRRELTALEDLGIEVKSADGLVDFRSLRDGEIVYLCWQFPEREISHWHQLDTGYAGRRAIAKSDGFAPSWAN